MLERRGRPWGGVKRGAGDETVDDLSLCASSTPTAARAAEQPTGFGLPLALSSSTLREQHYLAHIFDATPNSRGPVIMARSRRSLPLKDAPIPMEWGRKDYGF